jgi:stage II sporulation protein D
METFGKACKEADPASATVTCVSRRAPRRVLGLAAAGLVACAGAASVLATGPAGVRATTTSTAIVTSPASSVLVVSGHGWGHGLGLSQWGADGYAKHGWTYDRILAHYYSGTTLGPAGVAAIRVLLLQAKKATLSSAVPWTVHDAAGAHAKLEPGQLVLTAALQIGAAKTGAAKTGAAKTAARKLVPPYTFTAAKPLAVNGKAFRGKLLVSSDGKQLEVVNSVGLEAYLKGVVPAEMPSGWSPEALKAQAVAARSYALANLTKGRDFDLYGDTRSQVYGGLAAESPPASAAVDATKGEVVLFNGKVADTLFFSTSGGRTASAAETTGTAVPYLISVADPYDTASPYHDWGPVLFDAVKLTKQLKLAGPLADLQTTNGPSGRVKSVTAISGNDSQATLTGSGLRAQLELRSTWFTGALLRLLPAAKTVTYGGALSLTGYARGASGVTLESKTAAQDWRPAGELILDAGDAFATVVKPQVATQYRLALGNARIGLAKIAVAPRIDATATAAGAQGAERPAAAGAPVQLQQQTGTLWTTIGSTVADAAGAWSFAQPLQPGTYRVRCAPGRGLAPGVSALLTVQ